MTDQDPRFSAGFWDHRYRANGQMWSGRPNEGLIDEVASLTPGTALDVGCGEGSDAIWLAENDWQVSGVDFSAEAINRAAENTPQDLAERVQWIQADVREWRPGQRPRYDLVTSSFNHFPQQVRERVFAALADRVAEDGHLVIVGHHPSDLDTPMPRPNDQTLFYTAEELAADLQHPEWEILTSAERPRSAVTPDGTTVMIHDTVLTARRLLISAPGSKET